MNQLKRELLSACFSILSVFVFLSVGYAKHCIAGVGGSAGGPKMSWQEIDQNWRMEYSEPKAEFRSTVIEEAKPTKVSIFKVCKKGNFIHTKEPQPVYARVLDRNGFDRGEREVAREFLESPIEYEKEYCQSKGRRCEWVRKKVKFPLEHNIEIREVPTSAKRSFGKKLFDKEYRIEDCE